ncbi:18216_t:CDS:2, partial [Dentiscutata erythropus]
VLRKFAKENQAIENGEENATTNHMMVPKIMERDAIHQEINFFRTDSDNIRNTVIPLNQKYLILQSQTAAPRRTQRLWNVFGQLHVNTKFWDSQEEGRINILLFGLKKLVKSTSSQRKSMVSQNSEDVQPLIDQSSSQYNHDISVRELTPQHGKIPTPTGPTEFNMAFVSFLFAGSGALLFAGTVWYITSNVPYEFFIWHPTLMALTLLTTTFGILILQTTGKPEERAVGLNWHKLFQSIAFLAVIAGFTIISIHKNNNKYDHYTSAHGKAGLFTFSYIMCQTIFGSILVNFPGVVGGQAKAVRMYKYHRFSGYFLLALIYLTALGGTQAGWTRGKFNHIWVWLLATVLVIVGVAGRTKSSKLKIW